jgi:hypothetical protein
MPLLANLATVAVFSGVKGKLYLVTPLSAE